MKYNKSEIFKKAWSFVKNMKTTLSNGLKRAWAIAKCNSAEEIQTMKRILLQEGQNETFTISYKRFRDVIGGVSAIAQEIFHDKFIMDVCESVLKFRRLSEKQAYCIARYMVNHKIEYVF